MEENLLQWSLPTMFIVNKATANPNRKAIFGKTVKGFENGRDSQSSDLGRSFGLDIFTPTSHDRFFAQRSVHVLGSRSSGGKSS